MNRQFHLFLRNIMEIGAIPKATKKEIIQNFWMNPTNYAKRRNTRHSSFCTSLFLETHNLGWWKRLLKVWFSWLTDNGQFESTTNSLCKLKKMQNQSNNYFDILRNEKDGFKIHLLLMFNQLEETLQ